jgi:hypothetical protein
MRVMATPRKYSEELRKRATRLALDARRDPASKVGAIKRDRAMRLPGLSGIRRHKGIRTTIPAKDGVRAGTCSIATSRRRGPITPG